jgi:hypothetical protein
LQSGFPTAYTVSLLPNASRKSPVYGGSPGLWFFPAWFPTQAGKNHKPGEPRYTGDFLDGFGNKLTVYAVGNPDCNPIHAKAAGFGLVEFNKETRDIVSHCLRRAPADTEFLGWPITVNQFQNYEGRVAGWLPTLTSNVEDPVVTVYRADTKELVYAIRIKGNSFTPPVYEAGEYIVKVSLPDYDKEKVYTVSSKSEKDMEKLSVKL